MAKELVQTYSSPGDTILDPFSGSGTVPLEAAIEKREAIGIDRNPYSILLSKAKLHPPKSEEEAKESAEKYLSKIEPESGVGTDDIPEWVAEFFHPKTLSGIVQLAPLLRENDEHFLLACLLGILHHQRPGFLSYPASNLRPYLRDEKFPRDQYPEKYEYREIRPRLFSKIERAFRRAPEFDNSLQQTIYSGDSAEVINEEIQKDRLDTIITSPPYMNKLDYGRDNRLRLYFLGVEDYEDLDGSPENRQQYRDFLDNFLSEATNALQPGGNLIFVMGESQRSGAAVDTSEVLANMVKNEEYGMSVKEAVQDKVPQREINSMSTKSETILVLEN
ncbi:site-specific DNA-methyltransferase [Natrinema zhouii]|uniref:Type II methyltransferase n=1 Tax=Natrinema zhouii TaxID=1710539 RepID=A0A7D6H1N7_9EURY|nr:DNA methyltransferase [Natrinema zhouii]QLK25127.1 site-specific DNA-methyltransferase [Natrinema zhouii]